MAWCRDSGILTSYYLVDIVTYSLCLGFKQFVVVSPHGLVSHIFLSL